MIDIFAIDYINIAGLPEKLQTAMAEERGHLAR
jgi:hypothetical protein